MQPLLRRFGQKMGRKERIERVYLDHAATTPVRREVVEKMTPYFSDVFGNPASSHRVGQKAWRVLKHARTIVADCIGADPNEVCFTSGGTESDNLAIKGIAHANKHKGNHLITSTVEHLAVLNCFKALEQQGFKVTYLPVDRCGVLSPESVKAAIRKDTILISVMLANNETGTLQPVAELVRVAKEQGIPVHTDAVQALGKIPVNVDALGIDLLSLSGHKIYGPKGVGVLYVRSGTVLCPLLHGGRQEAQIRPGTENIPAIVGMSAAMELAALEMTSTSAHLRSLLDRLECSIHRLISNARLNGHPAKRLPNIVNMSFGSVDAESLMDMLNSHGVAVSTRSACGSGSAEPSHVLLAMGMDRTRAQSSLRFSLGRSNTKEEIDYVTKILAESAAKLREGRSQ